MLLKKEWLIITADDYDFKYKLIVFYAKMQNQTKTPNENAIVVCPCDCTQQFFHQFWEKEEMTIEQLYKYITEVSYDFN